MQHKSIWCNFAALPVLFVIVVTSVWALAQDTLLGPSQKISVVASTVPANGDVNPYGIVLIPRSVGNLRQGNLLISNFNNGKNLQGTGTTIMQISPVGAVTQFARIDPGALPGPCPGGVGLTTALVVLKTGWVIVGSLPTKDGTSPTARAGCLIVLNSHGKVVETFAGHGINGPWDMTAVDGGVVAVLFVTNVLNGTVASSPNVVNHATVLRLLLDVSPMDKPKLLATTVVGSGFSERTDPAALVIGPTGVAFDPVSDTLYVADSLNNRIAAIHQALVRSSSAGTGTTVSSGGALNDPLGMTLTNHGNIITANGNDGFAVETTPAGKQVAKRLLDNTGGPPPGAGTLFGLVAVGDHKLYFVDDGSNTLNLLH